MVCGADDEEERVGRTNSVLEIIPNDNAVLGELGQHSTPNKSKDVAAHEHLRNADPHAPIWSCGGL